MNKTGHFEPVGTHRGFRRLGLARAVMLHPMREMRALGMRTVTDLHDAENLAGKLYEALGLRDRRGDSRVPQAGGLESRPLTRPMSTATKRTSGAGRARVRIACRTAAVDPQSSPDHSRRMLILARRRRSSRRRCANKYS